MRSVAGLERRRLLHRDQGEQLEQVVLDHVAGGADAVVVAGPAADAHVLGHRDLHVVDVVGVPDRLEQLVGEPHRQDVLDGLLAEVVVDAEHRPGREDPVEHLVELLRGLQVVAERLLDDHPTPRAVASVGEPVLLELPDDVTEELRRDRQVERVVAAGAALLVELLDGALELPERLVVGEVAGHEPDTLGELLPDLLAELGPGVLLDRVVHDLREVLVGPVTPGEPDQAEAGRQQPAVRQVVDRRHHLLGGQVAGHAEEHQPARSGDPGKAPVALVAQRVRVALGGDHQSRCSR